MNPHDATITLCAAAAAGIGLIALAERLRVPSIALLLLGGVFLGPEVLGWVNPFALGAGLETVVTLAVAIVLFEGGLTLDIAGFRREPQVILRMLTVGVGVTWAGTALAVYFVYGVGYQLAIITGSLVIVTGPTVVSPLLRRIGVRPRLHHILYWEGVMIDAIGVFVAVLCYEWIAANSDTAVLKPLGRFAFRFAIGVGVGAAVGTATGEILRRRWISSEHSNIVVLAAALIALAIANSILHEAGILAVIVAGLVLSLRHGAQIKALKRFKLELTEVGIGLLFVLLAARLDLSVFVEDGGRLAIVLAVILFLLRPLNVAIATWGQGFSWQERAFLGWLAPRGIVAASMASLFALRLERLGFAEARLLETLTYAVIGTTVFLQGLSAPALARALGLKRKSRAAWLLIGDPALSVELHRRLRQADTRSIVLAATSDDVPVDDDIESVVWDPLDPESITDPRIADVETVLALAADPALNDKICAAWSRVVGPAACFRWDGKGATKGGAGRQVWREAPSPAHARATIEEGTHVIEALEIGAPADAKRFGGPLRPLLVVDDGRVTVVDGEISASAQWVIALRRRTPGLYGLVRDAVVIDRDETTFADAVSDLLERAAETIPGFDTAHHLADIVGREESMPTAIGNGVAVPHVYDEHAERSICFVANAPGGLDLIGPDEKLVHLVFLIVSPVNKANEHLRSLAAIAHLASNEDLIEVFRSQRARGRLLTLLREHE